VKEQVSGAKRQGETSVRNGRPLRRGGKRSGVTRQWAERAKQFKISNLRIALARAAKHRRGCPYWKEVRSRF
jgi:hypothetical protein